MKVKALVTELSQATGNSCPCTFKYLIYAFIRDKQGVAIRVNVTGNEKHLQNKHFEFNKFHVWCLFSAGPTMAQLQFSLTVSQSSRT